MSQIEWANNASTTLAVAISNSANVTSINVAAGTGALFPVPGTSQYFKVSLAPVSGTAPPTEIMHCTNVTGDALTVVRAQEGTTPQAWGTGTLVNNWITRDTLNIFAQVVTYAGNPNGNVAGTSAGAVTPPSMVWDTTDLTMWMCIQTGTSANAQWRQQAPNDSPMLVGTPSAPTAFPNTSTTQIATTAFANGATNLSNPGYVILPNTITFAWGTVMAPAAASGYLTTTFSVENGLFPTSMLTVMTCFGGGYPPSNIGLSIDIVDRQHFSITTFSGGVAVNLGVQWWAIGF